MFCSLCMSTVYLLTGLAAICVAARFVFKKIPVLIRGKHVLSTLMDSEDSEDSAEMEALADPAQDPAVDPAAEMEGPADPAVDPAAEMEDLAEPAEDPAAAAAAAAAAIAAFVAPLVGEFAAAVGATKQLQQLRWQPVVALESLVLHWINSEEPATILAQRGRFASLPGAMLKFVQSECDRMCHPPLVSLMVTNRTQDLYLNLDPYPPLDQGWTLGELESLCTDIVRECKTSLRRLKVNNKRGPGCDNPGLPFALLVWLLDQLSGLTSVHVRGDYKDYEVDLLISVLTHTNPGIRSLTMPRLSTKNLHSIAQTWPQLETLYPGHEFNSSEVAAVLPGLRNLNFFGNYPDVVSGAMLQVARAHDPATPSHKLTNRFHSPLFSPLDPGDMAQLFTAFPAIYRLTVLESDVPALCAALQGRDQLKVTKLWVESTSENPRALEPLLARVGKHLTFLDVRERAGFTEGRVDLGMIGHHCPKLEELTLFARELVADGEFDVTESFFARLERCNVHHKSPHGPAELPPPLVHALTCSPTLGSLWLRGVLLTEEMVAALAAEREAHGALSSLDHVTLRYHPSLSLRTLVTLVSHAPKLHYIWIQAEGEQERAAMEEITQCIQSYVLQSGLQVYINM